MASNKRKAKHCPNCGDINIEHKGNEILCLSCDCIFMITDKGEAKVRKVGALKEIQGRLDHIEQTIFKPDESNEPGESNEPDESENGLRLFEITSGNDDW